MALATEQQTRGMARIGAAVLVIALLAAVVYGWHEHSAANKLAAQNDAVSTTLKDTQTQLQALASKVDSMTAPSPAAPVPARHSAVRVQRSAHHAAIRRDDPRWKKFQEQLAAQGKMIDDHGRIIDATRQDLANAKTELGDGIAKNHGEIVLLQKKGERNYFEFDIDKTKTFSRTGPVGLRLKKANTKNQYADLEMLVDDVKLSQKHVNLMQPVQFYATDNGAPIELVINSINKNHIKGYVSEPKYRRSELAAMANTNAAGPSGTPAPVAPQRQKLELPKN
jgi:hypothetical protein